MKLHLKSTLIGLTMGTLIATQLPLLAAQGSKTLSVMFNNIKVSIDKQPVDFTTANGTKLEPFVYDGTTYVPLESIAKALGYSITSDPAQSSVTLSTSKQTPSVLTEFESNDTRASANVLPPTSTLTGNIGAKDTSSPSDHTDWFKVTLTQTGTLYLGLVGEPNQQLYLSIYGQQAEQPITSTEGKGAKLSLAQPLEPGTYYVKINTTPKDSAQPYRLSSKFTPISTPKDAETNDTLGQAISCTPSQKYTGHLGYASSDTKQDVTDWYTFEVPKNATVNFTWTLNGGLNGRFLLYDQTGKTLLLDERGQDTTLSMSKFLTKGTYYVQLKHLKGAGTYGLTIK